MNLKPLQRGCGRKSTGGKTHPRMALPNSPIGPGADCTFPCLSACLPFCLSTYRTDGRRKTLRMSIRRKAPSLRRNFRWQAGSHDGAFFCWPPGAIPWRWRTSRATCACQFQSIREEPMAQRTTNRMQPAGRGQRVPPSCAAVANACRSRMPDVPYSMLSKPSKE